MEIIGRLTADAKVNTLKNEQKVVNFSVAVNDYYKPKGAEQPVKLTNYFNCAYWMNPSIAQHLTKGTLVELYGRIGVNAWTNAEGKAKASLNFHVSNIKLHGKPNSSVKESVPVTEEIDEPADDLPF